MEINQSKEVFFDDWITTINYDFSMQNYIAQLEKETINLFLRGDMMKEDIIVIYDNEVVGKAREIKEDYKYTGTSFNKIRCIDLNQHYLLENLKLIVKLKNKSLGGTILRDCDVNYLTFTNCKLVNITFENCKGDIILEDNNIKNIKVNNEKINRQGEIVKRARKVYKKVLNPEWIGPYGGEKRELIATLELIPGSIVFCINGKKCRTNKALVVAIDGKKEKGTKAISGHDCTFIYEVGKVVEVKDFDLRNNIECGSGIHFFNTKKEAEDYWTM